MQTLPAGRSLTYGTPATGLHPLNRGLIGWWQVLPLSPGGPRWLDLTGRNHIALQFMAGAPMTSGLAPTTRPGGYGEVRFDGTDDYGLLAARVGATLTTQITIAAWLYAAGTTFQTNSAILGEQYDVDNQVCFALYGNPDGADATAVATGYYNGIWTRATLGAYPAFGRWAHVAGTYDGTTVLLYINGVQVASQAGGAALPPSANPWRVGRRWDDSTLTYWRGAIDDLRLYRRALSASEMLALYRESQRRPSPLLQYLAWPFGASAAAVGKAPPPFQRPWRYGRRRVVV